MLETLSGSKTSEFFKKNSIRAQTCTQAHTIAVSLSALLGSASHYWGGLSGTPTLARLLSAAKEKKKNIMQTNYKLSSRAGALKSQLLQIYLKEKNHFAFSFTAFSQWISLVLEGIQSNKTGSTQRTHTCCERSGFFSGSWAMQFPGRSTKSTPTDTSAVSRGEGRGVPQLL